LVRVWRVKANSYRAGLAVLINILEGAPASLEAGARTTDLRIFSRFSILAAATFVAGCTAVGPTTRAIERAPVTAAANGIRVVEISDPIAQQVNIADVHGDFAGIGDATPIGTRVGVGDTLEVTIWEAAPAALFGTANLDTGIGSTVQTSRPNTLPGMLVGPSGAITVPFAGQVPAAGRTLREIEQDIVRRLQGRAHLPQAMVRIAHNATADVTVLGDVKSPQRVPLTPKGERLLDAIAEAGGTSQPLDRMTIEINRGGLVQRMAARDVVRDPRQNIILRADDVVTALYQPYSFTVMGATGRNDEVRFEGVGLTLAQALGRIGGLQDMRADPRGVFLFRWEKPQLIGSPAQTGQINPDGLVPVIYQADLKRPETYFAAQHFRMRDGDVIYVSNSRVAELQRFVNIVSSSILPVATVRTIAP
jgi:polysaccharide biosynthesis/export protein